MSDQSRNAASVSGMTLSLLLKGVVALTLLLMLKVILPLSLPLTRSLSVIVSEWSQWPHMAPMVYGYGLWSWVESLQKIVHTQKVLAVLRPGLH
jgi:hypothetical protein